MKASTLIALSLAAASCLAGCSVGTYNIPDVPPVVMPEPEEDMFADLEMGGGESTSAPSPAPEAKPADAPAAAAPPAAAPEAPAAAPPAEEPKAPAKKKKK